MYGTLFPGILLALCMLNLLETLINFVGERVTVKVSTVSGTSIFRLLFPSLDCSTALIRTNLGVGFQRPYGPYLSPHWRCHVEPAETLIKLLKVNFLCLSILSLS